MTKLRTLMAEDDLNDGDSALTVPAGRADSNVPVDRGPSPQPQWLQDLATPCTEPLVRTDSRCPYMGFASPRSATWDSLRQLHARITEGTPFVATGDGQFELADPLRYNLVAFKQAWTERDEQYSLRQVKFSDPGYASNLKEEFLALCIAHLGERLVPTVSYLGGPKAGAVRSAADALREVSSAEWARKSPAHAATMRCPIVFARVITAVTIETRTAKKTGKPYQLAVGHVQPATLEELDVLDRALQDPRFLAQFEAANEVYRQRLATLQEIARRGFGS